MYMQLISTHEKLSRTNITHPESALFVNLFEILINID